MTVEPAPGDVDEAERLVNVEPARALRLALDLVERDERRGDHASASRAARAAGLAAFHHRGVSEALPLLRRSIRLARRAGSPSLEGLARMSLAGQLSYQGRAAAALREIDGALGLLEGADRLTAASQRGLILWNCGAIDEALQAYADVLVDLRASGDDVGVYTLLINRGAALLERLDLRAAEADFVEADAVATAVGDDLVAAYARANLGFLHVLGGDIPRALAGLGEAERRLRAAKAHVGQIVSFRSEALLAVRLLTEARAAAEEALAAFEDEGHLTAVAFTRLVVAQIAVRDARRRPHAVPDAAVQASTAVKEFRRLGREDQAVLAQLVAFDAAAKDPARRSTVRPAAVQDLAVRAARARWTGPAIEGWLLVHDLSKGTDPARARDALRAAARFRTGPRPADLRARAWYAEALLRAALADPAGAQRAALRGLRILDDFQVALPATDLRAYAAAHRADLADLGTGLALASGDARAVLRWAERGRATQLAYGRVVPPRDPEVAERLVLLRKASKDLDDLRSASVAPAAVERLRARITHLEREIRDLARLSGRREDGPGPGAGGLAEPPALGRELAGRALVEYLAHDGVLHAVTLVGGRVRLHHLGDLAAVAGLVERIPFAVQRMIRADRSPGGAAAARTLLEDAARRLDAILLEPLRETAGRDLVVVPTGVLQTTPWSVLPSCAGRPVTVAPSATVWLAAARRAPGPGPVLVAAGPRLRSAPPEAEAVAAIHGTTPLLDPDATVDAVGTALRTASLAHLATHGRLSAENPLFSHLLLSDGPLVVYDLERLDRLPHTVVLAACESGRHVVPAGDELLGLGAAFLAGGTAQLVASVVPVPDAETADLMTALHTRLAAGEPPAVALAAAQADLRDAGPVAAATAAGFVCIGAGYVPVSPQRPAT